MQKYMCFAYCWGQEFWAFQHTFIVAQVIDTPVEFGDVTMLALFVPPFVPPDAIYCGSSIQYCALVHGVLLDGVWSSNQSNWFLPGANDAKIVFAVHGHITS